MACVAWQKPDVEKQALSFSLLLSFASRQKKVRQELVRSNFQTFNRTYCQKSGNRILQNLFSAHQNNI
jgi:hypothetical protein